MLQIELYLTIARNKRVDIENSEEKSNDINVILIRGICIKFRYLLKINQNVFLTDIGNRNFSLYIYIDFAMFFRSNGKLKCQISTSIIYIIRYLNIRFTN